MRQAKCPTCGNVAEVGDQDVVTVCPYCKTCHTVDGAIVKEHYLVSAYYQSNEAIESLVLWVKKQIGAEEDLPLHLEIVSVSLDYYPFWHAELKAETKFSGIGQDATYSGPAGGGAYRSISFTSKPDAGFIDRGLSLTYPASPTLPSALLDYQFPTRSRKYFSEAYAKEYGGKIHNGVLDQKTVERQAKEEAARILGEFIAREIYEVSSREDKIELLSIFYLHAPIWYIQYKYRNKSFEAYVDASTGRVITATYPVSIEYRTIHGALSAANALAGFGLSVVLGRFSVLAMVGTLIGFMTMSGVLAARALAFGKAREEAE
ncbi:MAG: hypothetical protein HYU39_08445 [Thaumarchaeota archaeon]|nr:hypothetical protein [Nitrososphaerota archaeon]